ncbi:MAG: hypothetical protein P1P84_09745 [Deferrisomatales bacterium]|nr:hypothetical protein [Deferrisomatales bacterium]
MPSRFIGVNEVACHTPGRTRPELLLGGPDGPVAPAQRGSLEKIHRGGVRLLKIVDAMLELCAARSAPREVEPAKRYSRGSRSAIGTYSFTGGPVYIWRGR